MDDGLAGKMLSELGCETLSDVSPSVLRLNHNLMAMIQFIQGQFDNSGGCAVVMCHACPHYFDVDALIRSFLTSESERNSSAAASHCYGDTRPFEFREDPHGLSFNH